jgi:16S rRNA (cytidine1402-2'-O)-methyltransferase
MPHQTQRPQLGTLWIAATSLGDPRDIPSRSLDLLRSCPFLVFEEDKQARQFLKAAGVQRQWMRYTEQRETFTLEELEKELRAGHDAVYMSDQGTPGLADPGRDLVEVAVRIGAKVRPVPGPSSLTAAISVCPIDCRRFQFAGFPPRDENEREAFLKSHLNHPWPTVVFDTPYRMKQFFETLDKVLRGSGRKVFVGVDISSENEDYWWDTSELILKQVMAQTEKRNYVVIVAGNGKSPTQPPRQQNNSQRKHPFQTKSNPNKGPSSRHR